MQHAPYASDEIVRQLTCCWLCGGIICCCSMAAWTAASWCGLGCAPGGIPVFGSIPPAAAATAASDDVGGNHCCCIATGSMAKELVAGAPGLWLVIVAAGDRGAGAGGVAAPGHGWPRSNEGNSSQFLAYWRKRIFRLRLFHTGVLKHSIKMCK